MTMTMTVAVARRGWVSVGTSRGIAGGIAVAVVDGGGGGGGLSEVGLEVVEDQQCLLVSCQHIVLQQGRGEGVEQGFLSPTLSQYRQSRRHKKHTVTTTTAATTAAGGGSGVVVVFLVVIIETVGRGRGW